jgi:NADH-quinone oxidoreductase subunit C
MSMSPGSASAAALRAEFGPAIERHLVSCGDTIIHVGRDRSHDVLAWLRDTPGQQFDYLTDVTAVEYRDPELPLEVVYQLRSLARKADLRVKVELDKRQPLEVRSVVDLWRGADWLEREAYDMFGVVFIGHPDLRRILMWETYAEGYPLRKDFPLRGHFSRAEQTRQASPSRSAWTSLLRSPLPYAASTAPLAGIADPDVVVTGPLRTYRSVSPRRPAASNAASAVIRPVSRGAVSP